MARHTVKQPQPVMTRAGIVTALTVLSAVLVRLNLGDLAGWLAQLEDPIAGVVLAGGTLYSAALARRHVTPIARPRDGVGNDLVPAGSPVHAGASTLAAIALADEIYPAGDGA